MGRLPTEQGHRAARGSQPDSRARLPPKAALPPPQVSVAAACLPGPTFRASGFQTGQRAVGLHCDRGHLGCRVCVGETPHPHAATAIYRTRVGGGVGGLGNPVTSPTRAATSRQQASAVPTSQGKEALTCWRLRSSPDRTAGTFLHLRPCTCGRAAAASPSLCAAWGAGSGQLHGGRGRRAAGGTGRSLPGPASPPLCSFAAPQVTAVSWQARAAPLLPGPTHSGPVAPATHPGDKRVLHRFHFNALAFPHTTYNRGRRGVT